MASAVENEVIGSESPIPFNEHEEITVGGERGIWLNKHEVQNWRGTIPIHEYQINEDCNPEQIIKTIHKPVKYIQNVWIKYLKPPTPVPHGDLIIKQENDLIPAATPPIIIRQLASRPTTPENLIIRERPPCMPETLPQQTITVPGKVIDPPPRKVIIERMPEHPRKPQAIIIEKWLPYEKPKRRVILDPPVCKANKQNKLKNLIIQWNMPNWIVDQEVKYFDPEHTDPCDYIRRYGCSLKETCELPKYDYNHKKCLNEDDLPYQLEGDLEALHLLDSKTLEKLGLSKHIGIKRSCHHGHSIHSSHLPCNSGLNVIELKRHPTTKEFGLLIRGGKEFNMSLYVLKLVEEGQADLDGRLQSGDEIIQINGSHTCSMRLSEAVEAIRSKDVVSLLVKKTGLPPPSVTDVIDSMMNGHQL